MQFPFGPLAPDLGETAPGTVMVANGVLPLPEGYGPAPSLSVAPGAEALPDAPRGMAALVLNDGTWKVFAFTADNWYSLLNDNSWFSLAGAFNITADDDWSPVHFGAYLFGANTSDGLVAYNVELPAGFTTVAGAGKPRFIFACANYLVALDCLDDVGERNNRLLKVSGLGDPFEWVKKGADNQPLNDGGPLVFGADVKNNAALILQERAARLMQFGALNGKQFSLVKLSDGVGSVGARSCVAFDGAVYWFSTDGFRKYTLAGGIETIGAGFIDDWFLSVVDQSRLAWVQGSYDPLRKMVWWRFPRPGATGEVTTDIIGYSWRWDRWVTSEEATTYLTRIATPGITLDSMDAEYGPLDGINTLLDARLWQGGQPIFAALDSERRFSMFAGGAQAARITTSTQPSPVHGKISGATAIDDAANSTIELGVKDALSSPIDFKPPAGKGSRRPGWTGLRGSGNHIAMRWNAPKNEAWSFAKGIDYIEGAAGGAS
ncbi:hypothetical protein [Devosia sp. DBB001]|nr:hypothetical protein [Devosia sp. DBB001]